MESGATITATETGRPAGYAAEVRWILGCALVLFVWTVGIGILNGLDVVEFPRQALLTHLHVGTLAWISMSVFALSLVVFDSSPNPGMRWVARVGPLAALLYNVAFLTTASLVRPAVGSLMFLVIATFAIRGYMRMGGTVLSVPRLAILAALTTSIVGAVLGVLLGVLLAKPDSGIPVGVVDAHPAVMVVGFLIPAGMGFVEYVLRPSSVDERASIAGWIQIAAPFLGGVAIMVGLIANVFALVQLSLPLEIIGTLIFVVRLAPTAMRTSLLADSPARFAVPTLVFLPINVALLVSLIVQYAPNLENAPPRLFEAIDHTIFVGVMTFAIMGYIARMSTARVPSIVSQLVFWGMVVGLAGFAIALVTDNTMLIRMSTPILGVALLTAVAVRAPGMLSQGWAT